MDMTASFVCRAFLEKCPPQKQEALKGYLSDEEKKRIEALPPIAQDPTKGIAGQDAQLSRIHYSWFSPFLRTLSEQEIKLFAASLTPSQAEGLKKILLFTNHLPALAPVAKEFLQQTLLEKVSGAAILPIECLPDSPLNILLSLKEGQWRLLIDLLGMHDLSADMRLIIETAKLKRIHAMLSKEQLLYLKMLASKKEPLTFGRIPLDKWDGKAESLRTLVQNRGINRIAKALHAEDPSLLWHFTHQLDMESAASLQRLCTPLENRRALAYLSEQILEVVSHIQKQTAP